MRVRIDLKIIVFLILFLFTNQISVYLTMLIFCTLHEFGHIIDIKIKTRKFRDIAIWIVYFF